MFLEASVKRTLCSLRLPPLDLSGAGPEYNRRHIQHSRVLQIRLTFSNQGLRPHCNRCRAPIHSLTRCTRRYRVLFPFALASASSKAEALSFVRCPAEFTFIPLYRMASERRLRLAHPFVFPSNLLLGKYNTLSVGPRSIIRIPTYRAASMKTFPQFLNRMCVGKLRLKIQCGIIVFEKSHRGYWPASRQSPRA
jgi:hypothetical protein